MRSSYHMPKLKLGNHNIHHRLIIQVYQYISKYPVCWSAYEEIDGTFAIPLTGLEIAYSKNQDTISFVYEPDRQCIATIYFDQSINLLQNRSLGVRVD